MFAKLKAARNWAIVMGIIGILMLGIVLVLGKLQEVQIFTSIWDFSAFSRLSL